MRRPIIRTVDVYVIELWYSLETNDRNVEKYYVYGYTWIVKYYSKRFRSRARLLVLYVSGSTRRICAASFLPFRSFQTCRTSSTSLHWLFVVRKSLITFKPRPVSDAGGKSLNELGAAAGGGGAIRRKSSAFESRRRATHSALARALVPTYGKSGHLINLTPPSSSTRTL